MKHFLSTEAIIFVSLIVLLIAGMVYYKNNYRQKNIKVNIVKPKSSVIQTVSAPNSDNHITTNYLEPISPEIYDPAEYYEEWDYFDGYHNAGFVRVPQTNSRKYNPPDPREFELPNYDFAYTERPEPPSASICMPYTNSRYTYP